MGLFSKLSDTVKTIGAKRKIATANKIITKFSFSNKFEDLKEIEKALVLYNEASKFVNCVYELNNATELKNTILTREADRLMRSPKSDTSLNKFKNFSTAAFYYNSAINYSNNKLKYNDALRELELASKQNYELADKLIGQDYESFNQRKKQLEDANSYLAGCIYTSYKDSKEIFAKNKLQLDYIQKLFSAINTAKKQVDKTNIFSFAVELSGALKNLTYIKGKLERSNNCVSKYTNICNDKFNLCGQNAIENTDELIKIFNNISSCNIVERANCIEKIVKNFELAQYCNISFNNQTFAFYKELNQQAKIIVPILKNAESQFKSAFESISYSEALSQTDKAIKILSSISYNKYFDISSLQKKYTTYKADIIQTVYSKAESLIEKNLDCNDIVKSYKDLQQAKNYIKIITPYKDCSNLINTTNNCIRRLEEHCNTMTRQYYGNSLNSNLPQEEFDCLDNAYYFIKKAEEINSSIIDYNLKNTITSRMTKLENALALRNDAIKFFNNSIDEDYNLNKRYDNLCSAISCYKKISDTIDSSDDLEDCENAKENLSIEFYNKAVELFNYANDTDSNYYKQKNYEEALDYFKQANELGCECIVDIQDTEEAIYECEHKDDYTQDDNDEYYE